MIRDDTRGVNDSAYASSSPLFTFLGPWTNTKVLVKVNHNANRWELQRHS